MQIGTKNVNSKIELFEMIKEGMETLSYVKEEKDIDFISNAIIIEGNDEDPYFEEIAEIVFKSIIYYVLYTEREEKTLKRCKEIAQIGTTGTDGINEVRNIVKNEERAEMLFKSVEIAPEKTAKEIFEKLNERLSKI